MDSICASLTVHCAQCSARLCSSCLAVNRILSCVAVTLERARGDAGGTDRENHRAWIVLYGRKKFTWLCDGLWEWTGLHVIKSGEARRFCRGDSRRKTEMESALPGKIALLYSGENETILIFLFVSGSFFFFGTRFVCLFPRASS